MKHSVCIILLLILSSSCDRYSRELFNYYHLYKDERGEGYYLQCKLSSSCNAFIENIETFEYNRKYFIISQHIKDEKNWYIIKAAKEELDCDQCDTIIGPLTVIQKDSILRNEDVGKLKKLTFKYPSE